LANKFSGIKLLGEADPNLPLPPLKLFLSRYSKSAAKAILDAGGEVTAVYRNKLGLRAEKLGMTEEIKMADPTRKNDIGESASLPLEKAWQCWG
jgi:large subunit ribosomal protein L15